ncbi:hypothetical protein INT46_006336 [Mucor plumbeus]|uniref:Uncharacterized protein n=1 Tax=Mucor plumbeus TaxID=97098 RepID=A0A8H7QUD8_9FUNG|nr:hypothetical protein INT46_006336 [Mucor plumbeus]
MVPVDVQRDPLLSFGKSLGFDRLLSLLDLRSEIITKDAHDRSLDPPVDVVEFFPGTLVLHKNFQRQDKLDVHWRRTNGTHLRRYFDRPDDRKVSGEE